MHLDADKVLSAYGKFGRYQVSVNCFIVAELRIFHLFNLNNFCTKYLNFTESITDGHLLDHKQRAHSVRDQHDGDAVYH